MLVSMTKLMQDSQFFH